MTSKHFHLLIFLVLSLALNAQSARQKSTTTQTSETGTGFSYGISAFGLGLVGVPLRYTSKKSQLEAVLSYAPGAEIRSNTSFEIDDYTHGVSIGLGYNLFVGERNKTTKEKRIKHFIGLKGELVTNLVDQFYGGVTWRREAVKTSKSRSFGFDLGLGYLHGIGGNEWYNSGLDEYISGQLAIFFRLDWNWYKK